MTVPPPQPATGHAPDEADGVAAAESVVVAINIRPLVDAELAEGCKECLLVTPGEPQVGHGAHLFTYDHVFCDRGIAEPPAALYDRCVAPLVDGLFRGYNATVFAYGQTGSGKTYTMGSAFAPGMGAAGGAPRGVIPQVMEAIFSRIAAAPRDIDFSVRVGFVEIHKEEIHDLLCTRGGPQPAVHIREVAGGGVCLAGAAEREVRSRQEMVEVLEQGTLLRATAATGMNKQSSRSHAIFTITLEQRRLVAARPGGSGRASADGSPRCDDSSGEDDDEEGGGAEVDDSYLCAKMHLVDLAGSERAKRTKAVGQRLQEGININKGLLALGNVINALSEGKAHVPYRDSKLTRMLQDSLGGNSRTVMIACVSPADVNLEESLNTLRYANRARNIRNKPVVNRDPVAAQIAHMRQQMAALRAENQSLKAQLGLGDGAALDFGSPADEALRAAVEALEARNRALQAENKRLRVERDSAQDDVKDATEKMIVAQAQRDKLQRALEQLSPEAAAEAAAAAEALAGGTSSEGDVVRGQLERIAELEREVKRLKQVSRLSGAFAASMRRQSLAPGSSGDLSASPFALSPLIQSDGEEDADVSLLEQNDDEYAAREQAQLVQQSHLHSELVRLNREMAAKEHALHSMSQHAALKQKYDERLLDLQQQRDELQRERADLMQKLEVLQHASEEERLRLRAQYETRIKQLDEKVKAVRAKEKRVLELERMKSKAEAACKKLEHDVLAIKQQKVVLHRAMEKSTKEFAEWKRQRDRELLQLKKQGRLNAAQLQKLEALHSKQQAVLRRKTEEAEAARRRLKEMEDRQQRLASRPTTAQPAPPAERPFTAPPVGSMGAGFAGQPPRLPTGAGGAAERSAPSASAAAGSAESECQPNALAPLLRDEKGRREWIEGELDAYCSSYELQKVMEGERAQRSEAQRKLREVEKALASIRNPEWWGPTAASLVSPSGNCEEKLVRRKMALLAQSEEHSKAFEAAQARLLEARQAEEARGGVPADAKRWNGVRSVVQARALLKSLFRSASQHKAQAIEASAQVTELSEEIELLKLRLDIAEAEKYEAAQQVAKYQVLLEKAEATSGSGSTDAEAATPSKQLLPPAVAAGDLAAVTDEGLREAHEILQQLNTLATDDPLSAPPGAAAAAEGATAGGAAAGGEGQRADEEGSPLEEESWESEEEEEEEEDEASSEDEERHALWDPSLATPARGLKSRKPAGAGGEARAQLRRRSSTTSGGGGRALPEEQPVLAHLNEQLLRQGKEPVAKLTVALMKEVLKDRVIGGRRWRLGSKKRDDLVRDYRVMLGLQPDAESGATFSAAPQQQQQQQPVAPPPQQPSTVAQQPLSSRGGEGASGTGGAGSGSAPVFSRLLEHTASSLARCADRVHHPPPSVAAQQQQQHNPQQQQQQTAAVQAPASRAAFGSPVPPPRSRGSTAGQEGPQARVEAGSTPVGVEGQTPEGTAPEVQQREGQRGLGALSPEGKRNLQLQDLHSQLTALAQQGAVTLGLNPNAPAAAAAAARPATSSGLPGELQPGPGAQQGGSPARRSFSLAGWGRSASPRSPARRPDEQQQPHPAAAAARADAELKRSGSGSPGRLARLFGRGAAAAADGGRAKQGVSAAAAGTPGEVTYDLQQQPVRPDKPGTAGRHAIPGPHPLRCSNSSVSSEVAGGSGSRVGSPRDAGLAADCAPENRAGSAGPSGGPSPLDQPSAGRPRSGGGSAPGSAAVPHRSPRRQAWKPL